MNRTITLAAALVALTPVCRASSVEVRDVTIGDAAGLRSALAATGQTSDLARLALRVDAQVLAGALGMRDAALARSTLSLVPYVDRPAAFLPVLVDLAASRDRDAASRAARAASMIAARLDARSEEGCADDQCDLVEVHGPMVDALRRALTAAGVGADVRRDVVSVLATDAGRAFVPEVMDEIEDLLEDPDPRVRTAAATLMTPPPDEDALEALIDAASGERDPAVAAACLLAACAAMGLPEAEGHRRSFEKRLARLVGKLDPEPGSLVPLAACLEGIGSAWASEQAATLGGGGR